MTIREFKELRKEINRLKSKAICLRSASVCTTQILSGIPLSHQTTDKIGSGVAEFMEIERQIDELTEILDAAIKRLSREIFVENCIYLYLTHRDYTWRRIAFEVTGREDTTNSIKKLCYKYDW